MKNTALSKANEFIKKHWIFSTFVARFSGLWYSLILTYWGEFLGLVKISETSGKSLSWIGIACTGLVFVLTVSVVLIQKLDEDSSGVANSEIINECEKYKTVLGLLNLILVHMGRIYDKKSNTQLEEIYKIKKGEANPENVFTAPCEQLKKILESMSDVLSSTLTENEHSFRSNDFYLSLAYNFPFENPNSWHWADNNIQLGASLRDLLSSNDSTLSRLINSKDSVIFFNSKQEAFEKKSYIPDDYDRRDGNGNLLGSVACYKIYLQNNNQTWIRAVLSIATYNKPFSKSNDKDSIDNVYYNMDNTIVKAFEKVIRVELCNFYMQFLYNNTVIDTKNEELDFLEI